ncbi:LysM peptidoglycan-binding domain-containing protein [bacterium]|nr:LysM peptidoglycan-binding domain-containing protein [bacterium]
MSGPVNKVGSQAASTNKINNQRPEVYQVKPNDTIAKIAKNFGMSVDEFKEWSGLKSGTLKTGQKITLPTDVIPKGKGLLALAKKYGMTLDEFCNLNSIPKPYNNYKPDVNEKFYVKQVSTTKSSSGTTQKQDSVKTEQSSSTKTDTVDTKQKSDSSKVEKEITSTPTSNPTIANKKTWGSSFTPQEIAQQIKDAVDNNSGAVGKPVFDNYLNEINPKNVVEVIEAYKALKTGETLLDAITSEVGSKKDSRKAAVMHIYDAMAARKGTSPEIRKKFEKELNDQFNSMGMVNTKRLDTTLRRMNASPMEIAKDIRNVVDKQSSAVGKHDFDELLLLINSKNAAEVIKSYKKISPKESLLNAITSEVGSKKDVRKAAVMHIYDNLAKQHNIDNPKVRSEFKQELDKEFNKLIGMVNTENLDQVLDNIISGNIRSNVKVNTNITYENPKADPNTKVTFTGNNKTMTVAELYRGTISGAKTDISKKFKEFCRDNKIPYNEKNLDLSPIDNFPEPTVKGATITTIESKALPPLTKSNGKVIILNPGHGSYSSSSGFFDPGVYTFVKRKDGKYVPFFEYEKMKEYANDFSTKLRKQGYTVVIAGGHANTMRDQNTFTDLVSRLNNGHKNGTKYSTKDIAFISLHADSMPGKSGSSVCYDSNGIDNTTFAKFLVDSLNEEQMVNAKLSERVPGKNGLLVLNQTQNIPSVLLEVEFLNGSESHKLQSSDFRNRFEAKVLEGLNEYFDIK